MKGKNLKDIRINWILNNLIDKFYLKKDIDFLSLDDLSTVPNNKTYIYIFNKINEMLLSSSNSPIDNIKVINEIESIMIEDGSRWSRDISSIYKYKGQVAYVDYNTMLTPMAIPLDESEGSPLGIDDLSELKKFTGYYDYQGNPLFDGDKIECSIDDINDDDYLDLLGYEFDNHYIEYHKGIPGVRIMLDMYFIPLCELPNLPIVGEIINKKNYYWIKSIKKL